METSSWVKRVKRRIQDKKCVICGNDASVTYNSFPLCRSDDVVLMRRIQKAESFASTKYEANISTAREICIDSPNPEVAAIFILVEYGGYDGMIKYLQPSEIEILESSYSKVLRYIKVWDSISSY